MSINRRSFLMSAAFVGATGLAGCTTAQIADAQAQWANVVSQIQKYVSVAAQYIPTIESVAATAASLFGPQYAMLVQVGSAAFNQIINVLSNLVTAATPPAQAHLMARLRTSSPRAPVAIGTTAQGVTVIGWRA